MPAVRIAREASTGVTTNLGGTAANPTAGPNNWVAQVNNFVRISGGGFQGTASGGFNVAQINLGAPLTKAIWTISDPAAAIAAADGNQGLVEFGHTTDWLDSVKYFARPFTASGSNYFVFGRAGAGSNGADDAFLNCTTLNSAVPWTFTVERTSATTFSLSATDGGTPVTGTFTDTGDTARPSGNVLVYTQRFQNFITLDLDMYVEDTVEPPQLASPASDVSAGPWQASTGSDLYAMIDEETFSDTDYCFTTGDGTFEVALEGLTDPGVDTGHVVHYRIAVSSGKTMTVALRQGASTTIKSWNHSGPISATTFDQTLTEGEASAITNYGDLRLRFTIS